MLCGSKTKASEAQGRVQERMEEVLAGTHKAIEELKALGADVSQAELLLRDADQGKPQRPVHVKLLDAMLRGVSDGRFVCPITEAVFFELDRQCNTERRMQTVRMRPSQSWTTKVARRVARSTKCW